MSKTLVVAGGGAAGFFCAVNAARIHADLRVILLEKSSKLLSKVRVSGGGRCNVTHACFDISEMSRNYPRGNTFVKKSFHQFFTHDTVNWFGERGVKLKTEKDGRMFPVADTAQAIIDCLLREAAKYKVEVRMNIAVNNILPGNGNIALRLSDGSTILAHHVCIACGGFPKKEMFNWLRETGHTIEDPVPSLFTFNLPGHPICSLMGVSVPSARARIAGTKLEQEGPLLITHWGLSGPAILKLSAWGARELAKKKWNFTVLVNWVPNENENSVLGKISALRYERATQKIKSNNPFVLPQRLWEFMLSANSIDGEKRWADLPAKLQNKLARQLTGMEMEVRGKTTFKEEFVTAGGIRLSEIDPNTMMSRKCGGLYFAGEILDVDGITGGFNFQHAWTSGFIAAKLQE
jgi:predicted Rossmann fold flavoprotein